MRKLFLAGLAIAALAGCGKDDDATLGRDTALAVTDSTYALNDRPAPSPAPSPSPAPARPAPAPPPAPAAAPRTATLASGTVI